MGEFIFRNKGICDFELLPPVNQYGIHFAFNLLQLLSQSINMATAMMPVKAKKKRGKVEPLHESGDTELHTLEVASPSTSDFEEFFDTSSDRDAGTSGPSRPVSGGCYFRGFLSFMEHNKYSLCVCI